MELLYLWIEDYKNIHHQGFNFSPQYRFKFEPEFKRAADGNLPKDKDGNDIIEVVGGTLKDEIGDKARDNVLLENFFEPSQKVKDACTNPIELGTITNITAIVGANGAGKSNLLDFIKDNFREEFATSKKNGGYKFISIIRDEKIKYIYSSNITTIQKMNEHLEEFLSSKEASIYSFIFYSNQLTPYRNEKSSGPFEMPYSLISVSLCEFLERKTIVVDGKTNKEILTNYFLSHLKTQMDFIQILKDKGINLALPFNLPKFLNLTIAPNYRLTPLRETDTENVFPKFKNLFELYAKLAFDLPPESNEYELAVRLLKLNNTNRILSSIAMKFEAKHDLDNFFTNWGNYNSISELDEMIKRFVNAEHERTPYRNERIIIKDFGTFMNEFERHYKNILGEKEIFLQDYFRNEKFIKEDFTFSSSLESFLGIFKSYFELHYDYFNISWQGLSSGEDAFISIYSRFYSAITPTLFEYNYKEESTKINLLILIDEGEVGFHPDWQKKYLKYLVDFFPQIYPGANIQIILTTHSPFLASDLPKENIIFLEKGNKGEIIESDKSHADGKCIVVDGLNEKKQTFGANIHTLLSDSFFLQNGLMGEFANNKIQSVIDYLNGRTERNLAKDKQYQSIIDIIGEPILKRRLQLMMDSKRLEKVDNHEKEIQELKKRIEILEKQNKEKD